MQRKTQVVHMHSVTNRCTWKVFTQGKTQTESFHAEKNAYGKFSRREKRIWKVFTQRKTQIHMSDSTNYVGSALSSYLHMCCKTSRKHYCFFFTNVLWGTLLDAYTQFYECHEVLGSTWLHDPCIFLDSEVLYSLQTVYTVCSRFSIS